MTNALRTRATVLCFGDFTVELSTGLLLKRGVRVRLREQSFRVLASLLEHPGQVATREDLQRRLWPADVFVDFENNLNAAIGRLREALGDSADHPRFIETLPKRGYRFIGTVVDEPPVPRALGARCRRRWRPAAGLEVPGTPWVLEERLGHGGFGEVWLGRHRRLKEERVFKFCVRGDRVRALKREMTLFRVWRARVGDHPYLVQLLGVNLDRPPFYLEEEYVAGRDLRTWCAAQGGIGKVPVGVRLELMAQAADGLAAAHEAGIVHRDIKPGNILVSCRQPAAPRDPSDPPDELSSSGRDAASAGIPLSSPEGVARELAALGVPTAKVTDFGIGHVMSAQALAGITATGLTATSGPVTSAAVLGTHAYLAPELLMGRPATAQSDLYAMGVMLYQLLVEDFAQPVTTDWARAIHDAVAQEDLQRCLAGRPEERFGSARELAEHLRSLSARQEARARTSMRAFDQGDTHIASLAVLPFANLSADPENEFLSDGISEDLLVALSRVPGLRVPGRTSCFAFKGKAEDLRRIGHDLGVETVLEGSVRRVESRLRITAQLISVADGLHLWSERYERELADVFAVQDEITQAITAALIPKLSGHSLALVKPYAGSVDAYELCLRARYQHQKRTPASLKEALRLFEQAIVRDPDCALAYAGVAHVCLLLCYFGGLRTQEGMPRMKAAALRAVELDETLAVAHVRLADALCFIDWNWAAVDREFTRALELDPDNSEALCRYGLFLWARLRNAEALAQLQKALHVDPFSMDVHWFLGWVNIALSRFDEAEEVARRMVTMDPNLWTGHHVSGWIKVAQGLWAEAIPAWETAAAIEGGPANTASLCSCYARAGRLADARRTLERLERMKTERIVPPTWMALAYEAVGDQEQVRACMEQAREERHMFLVHLRGYMASTGWLSQYRGLLDQHGL